METYLPYLFGVWIAAAALLPLFSVSPKLACALTASTGLMLLAALWILGYGVMREYPAFYFLAVCFMTAMGGIATYFRAKRRAAEKSGTPA